MFKVVRGMELNEQEERAFDEFTKRIKFEWYNGSSVRNIAIDLLTCRDVGHEMVIHETLRTPRHTIQVIIRGDQPDEVVRLSWASLVGLDNLFKKPQANQGADVTQGPPPWEDDPGGCSGNPE